jgi:hypothetical protein
LSEAGGEKVGEITRSNPTAQVGKMGQWFVADIRLDLTGKLISEKLPFKINPAKDGIFDIPLFHHFNCGAKRS